MSINADQLRHEIIRPVIQRLNMHSKSAENLLMGIAAHESHLGTFLKQIGGPALGIFQMEPATEKDIWSNYLHPRRRDLIPILKAFRGFEPEPNPSVCNLAYQVAMARIFLWRIPEPLPVAHDIPALAQYWKKHWNTRLGKGTEADFIENYNRFIGSGE